MLILKDKLWEDNRILKIISSDNWTGKDTGIMLECVFQEIRNKLEEARNTERKGILILDSTKGEVPPLFYLGKIVSFLLGIKKLLQDGLQFTLLYSNRDSGFKTWVDIILKMYTPARPLFVVNTEDEIKYFLRRREDIDFGHKIEIGNSEEIVRK